MEYKLNDVYYLRYMNHIGGIETHLYYLAKKYGNRDLTLVFRGGNAERLAQLRKYIRVVVLSKGDTVTCERAFLTYDLTILNQIKAKEYFFVLHNDYQKLIDMKRMHPEAKTVNPIFKKYLAVSKAVKAGFCEDADVDVVYFPVDLDEFEEPVSLVSATRLTPEKGFWRYKKLAEELDKAGANYLWHIYTNEPKEIGSENVVFMKPRTDVVSKFPLFDACVQLSDVEGYSVTIQEALKCGLPMVVTPLPMCTMDLKLNENNSVYVPFDMENLDGVIEKIRNIKELKRNMKPVRFPKEKWDAYITKTERAPMAEVEVKVIRDYYDMEFKETMSEGRTFKVNEDRAQYLIARKLVSEV